MLAGTLIASCGSKEGHRTGTLIVDSKSVEVRQEIVGGDTLIVARLGAADPVVIPASEFIDSLYVVRLDSADEALVGNGWCVVSDSSILIYDYANSGQVKKFGLDGSYICNIGAKGQGPGEYAIAPYDIYADDATGNVYIAQYSASKLMSYGPDGTFLGDIPLAQYLPKGRISVDPEAQTVSVAAMQFDGRDCDMTVWTQDFEGRVISSDSNPVMPLTPDFSNEIFADIAADPSDYNMSLLYFQGRQDTLYNVRDGKLHPAFTVDFGDNVPAHDYHSFGSRYVVTCYGDPQQVSESSYIIPAQIPCIIDPATLTGGYAHLMLDQIGPVVLESWVGHSADKFVRMYDPGQLIKLLEKAEERKDLVSEDRMAEMRRFRESISEEDNNYVIYGKWKD